MKNVALVILQQYERVNFFCRTQHCKSRDDGRQWEDGGGEEESSGEHSDVIRFRAHLEWFECQRLFVDDSSMSILWGVCYSPGKPVRTHLNPPPPHPPTGAAEHRSQVFKQQMGQGQRCEMVKSLVKTAKAAHALQTTWLYMTRFSALMCKGSRQVSACGWK